MIETTRKQRQLSKHRWVARIAAVITLIGGSVLAIAAPANAVTSADVNLGGTTYTLGYEWENNNYMGARILIRASYQCTVTSADWDVSFGDLPATWPNQISSFQNSNNCYTNHYADTFFGGGQSGLFDDRTSMPSVPGNDNAESLRMT